MPTITPLSDETINQIAAGEVIESPACAVKELVENALDAGSTQIHVAVWDGGLSKIEVSDNGCGMSKEDAKLCIIRHATSKIKEGADLFATTTMGFRGEALAAISAIGSLCIETQEWGEDTGIALEVEKGKIVFEEVIAKPPGTRIKIRSLFLYAPVRRSFQPSNKRAANAIKQIVTALALSAPAVAFTLFIDEKKTLSFPVPSQKEPVEALKRRMIDIFGPDWIKSAICIESKSFYGFVAGPANAGGSKSSQWLFINNRFVTSSQLESAVKAGLATAIDEDKIPPFCLHVSLPLESVDINIHPKKKRVEFKAPGQVGHMITSKIISKLAPSSSPSPIVFEKAALSSALPMHLEAPFEKSTPKPLSLFSTPSVHILAHAGPYTIFSAPGSLEFEGIWLCHSQKLLMAYLFETLGEPQVSSQTLAIPLSVHLATHEINLLLDESSWLKSFGFSCREAGPTTLLIEESPPLFSDEIIREICVELAHLLSKGGREKLDHVILKEKFIKKLRRRSHEVTVGEREPLILKVLCHPAALQNPLYQQAFHALTTKSLDKFFPS